MKKKEAATVDIRIRPSTHRRLKKLVWKMSTDLGRRITIPDVVESLLKSA